MIVNYSRSLKVLLTLCCTARTLPSAVPGAIPGRARCARATLPRLGHRAEPPGCRGAWVPPVGQVPVEEGGNGPGAQVGPGRGLRPPLPPAPPAPLGLRAAPAAPAGGRSPPAGRAQSQGVACPFVASPAGRRGGSAVVSRTGPLPPPSLLSATLPPAAAAEGCAATRASRRRGRPVWSPPLPWARPRLPAALTLRRAMPAAGPPAEGCRRRHPACPSSSTSKSRPAFRCAGRAGGQARVVLPPRWRCPPSLPPRPDWQPSGRRVGPAPALALAVAEPCPTGLSLASPCGWRRARPRC